MNGLLLFGLISLFLCCGVGSQGAVRLSPNVAPRGVASQSSTWVHTDWAASPFIAGHANDGDLEAHINITYGTCSRTKITPPVWWQVDLLTVYEINKVAITNWNKGCGLWDIYIDVSNNTDGSSAVQCAYEPKAFNGGETRVYTCPCGMFGRYVRIRCPLDKSFYLCLCEVQIQPAGYCPEPEEMDNTVRSVPHTHYEVGINVTYTCDECYTGGGTSTCQCNKTWSPVQKCRILYKHCESPGSIENGEMEGNPPFTCVSTLKYTCYDGYWLLGAQTLRCGIYGQWDHGKPQCINNNLGCGEPPKISNAQRFGSVIEVTYQCDEGYTGGGNATCQNGEWDFEAKYVGDAGHEAQENTGNGVEKCNDGLVQGLIAAGSILGGVLVCLLAVFLCRRQGIDPCARFTPPQASNTTTHEYVKPNSPAASDEEYAELDDVVEYETPMN